MTCEQASGFRFAPLDLQKAGTPGARCPKPAAHPKIELRIQWSIRTVQCWASRVSLFPLPRAGLNPQTYPNHESGARFIPTMTEFASKKYPAPSGSYLGPYITHPMNALKGAQNPSACELLDATISSTPTKQPVINFGKRDASFVSLLLFRASTVAAYPFSVGSLSRGSLVCF